MNCKPGDLAIVVKSEIGNEGRIVRVVRAINEADKLHYHEDLREDDTWIVEGRLLCQYENVLTLYGREIAAFDGPLVERDGEMPYPDSFLRPLRADFEESLAILRAAEV